MLWSWFCRQLKANSQKHLSLAFSLVPLLLITPAVVYAQWEPDVRLTYNDSTSSLSQNNAHCIAASGDTVHVVWHDNRTGNYKIYYKRSTDAGTTWGQDTCLTSGPDSSTNPSIAISGLTLHLVWQDHRDGNWEIYNKRSTDGGSSWGSDARLTADTMQSRFPSLAVLDTMIHVVWSADFAGLFYKRSTDNGMSWSSDTSLRFGGNPCISLSDTILHLMYDLGGNMYYRRSTDMGLTWSDSTILAMGNIYPFEMHNFPSVSAFESNVHGVWEYFWQFSSRWYCAINYKKSTDGGSSWLSGSQIASGVYSLNKPVICVSDANVHVVWCDGRDGGLEIYCRRSHDEGATWEPETRLTSDSAWSRSPFIAAQGTKVHIIWADNRDGNYEIYYKRNPTGNSGVGESSGSFQPLTSNLSFSVVPNPFTSFATIPGHSSECFALYDISGRRVGDYRGYRIGSGLSAGVYFLRPFGGNAKPLRIVKLR